MNAFIEKCNGKPSVAVRAMVAGLREIPERGKFEVNMSTFGRHKAGVCFGCAATCTIQKIGNTTFTPENIYDRDLVLEVSVDDMVSFETAIDCLRWGEASRLLTLFKVPPVAQILLVTNDLPVLDTDNYLEGLPAYEAYADMLEAAGY